MAVSSAATLHARALRLPAPELVRELLDHLGPTAVAALAGVRDRKQPYRWASTDGAAPRDQSLGFIAWSSKPVL